MRKPLVALLLVLCGLVAIGLRVFQGDDKGAPLTPLPDDGGPAQANLPPEEGSDPAIADKSLARRASGMMDIHNRYATTVMLTEGAQSRAAQCSGILLTPSIALTAASCVCLPGKPGTDGGLDNRIIDATDCAQRTFLRTVHYGEVQDLQFMEETTSKSFQTFEGRIHPHPDFKLMLDAQGAVQSSHADLAVIVLDSPIQAPLSFVRISDSEVKENEMLVMAGCPVDSRFGGFAGIRYFRKNRVTQALGSPGGRVRYEQQAPFLYNGYPGGPCIREDAAQQGLVGIASVSVVNTREAQEFRFRTGGVHILEGDSGGPCFRETSAGRWLVGLSGGFVVAGQDSWFTSTFHYREWIERRKRELPLN